MRSPWLGRIVPAGVVGCAASARRILTGLAFLATVVGSITGVRLLGLALDGPAPFTLFVLKPELALVTASTTALVLERRRLSSVAAAT
jgi:hypothetical protein